MNNKALGFEKMLEDRFGMFVHYGIYSEMAGKFKGRVCPGIGEWIQHRLEIPIREYEDFGRKNFLTKPSFAKELVEAAKSAGIRYIVLTTKHHDGFCLFKSDYTDYSTYGFFGRDICRELAEECRRAGLELGFYYSHALDWHEKDGGGNFHCIHKKFTRNRNYWDFPDDNIDFEKYLREKSFPQVRELLTNYGDLKLIWFDFPHDITKELSEELRNLVKSIQPNCQINSRIAHGCNDYESLGDNTLPIAPVGVNTECLITLNNTWGYKEDDKNWKTPKETAEILCRAMNANSSLLLNVGPMGDGTLTDETLLILKEMGEWTRRNEEAVYGGVKGNPFSTSFSWGYVSRKEDNLYLYVTKNERKEITINIGEGNTVKEITLLGSGEKPKYLCHGNQITVTLSASELTIPVYKVEFTKKPVFPEIPMQNGDALSLGALWAHKVKKGNENGKPEKLKYEKSTFISDYGKNGLAVSKNCQAYFWDDAEEIMCWDAVFEEAGEYSATMIHASFIPEDGVKDVLCGYTLTVGGLTREVNMSEELSRYSISKTENAYNTRICRDAGKFNISAPGKYRVLLERKEGGDSVPVTSIEFAKTK